MCVWLQIEAGKLKAMVVGGSAIKLVAVGIGSMLSAQELSIIASQPVNDNVVTVEHTDNLGDVKQQLKDAICTGNYSLYN